MVDGCLHDGSGSGRVILCSRLGNSPDADIDWIFGGGDGDVPVPYCLLHIILL